MFAQGLWISGYQQPFAQIADFDFKGLAKKRISRSASRKLKKLTFVAATAENIRRNERFIHGQSVDKINAERRYPRDA